MPRLLDLINPRRLAFYAVFPAALLAVPMAARAADEKPAEKITYQDHALPLFRNNCLGCHNPDKKKAGLDLSTYQAALAGSDNGPVINPGDPGGSKLFKVTTHAEEPTMPPKKDKLPDKELDLIRKWIAGGAIENASGKPAVAAKPKVDLAVVASAAKPTGPVAMPRGLPADPVVHTDRPGAVVALAASPWAPVVAVGGQRQILLYQSQSLDLLGVLPFPEGLPHVLRFSRNGSLLLAGGGIEAKSGKVVLFDVATGNRVTEVGDEFDAVLAADITGDQSVVALGGPNRLVKGYAVADSKLLFTIKKHTDWVTAIACSPDGQYLASADRAGGIFVWEAKTGHEVHTLAGHKEAVADLCFRDDSMVLASCSTDGTVKLWNMDDGKELKSWAAHGNYRPPTGAVGAGTFDPAVGALSVAFTHDGRLVTCGRDKNVKLWDPNGGQIKALAPPFSDVALHATYTDDGTRVVAGDYTGQLRVWNVADGKVAGELSLAPASVAERLEAAIKKLTEGKPAAEKALAEAAAAQDAAGKAAAELQAIQAAVDGGKKAIADAEAKAKQMADAIAPAQQAAKKALADVEAKRQEATRLAAAVQQAESAAKNSAGTVAPAAAVDTKALDAAVAEKQAAVTEGEKRLAAAKDALSKKPDDAALKAEVDAAQASLGRRTQRLAEAKKALDDVKQTATGAAAAPAPAAASDNDAVAKAKADAERAAAEAKAAEQASADAAKASDKAVADAKAAADALAKAKADADAAAKAVPAKQDAAKAAALKAAAAKQAADVAAAQLKDMTTGVARLKADQAGTALAAAKKALADLESQQTAANEAVKTAQAAADKAAGDAVAFEKSLPEAPQRLKARQAAADQAKASAGAAKTVADAAAEDTKQREALAQQSADLSQKLIAAVSKSKDDKGLAEAADKAKATADLLTAALNTAKTTAAAKADESKKAADAQAAAEAEVGKAKNEAENGPKLLADLKKAAEAAVADVPKKKAAAEAAAKPIADAKAKADGLKAEYDKLDREAQQLATPAGPTTQPAKT